MFGNFKKNVALLIAALVLIADQASKFLALKYLQGAPEPLGILPFFNLVFVLNKGVSFGVFSGLPYGQYLLSFLAFAFVIFLIFLLRREELPRLKAAYAMIIGGALGNILDRIIHGGVVDFLDFYAGRHHWPAFNIADSSIFLGVSLALFCEFRKKKRL